MKYQRKLVLFLVGHTVFVFSIMRAYCAQCVILNFDFYDV